MKRKSKKCYPYLEKYSTKLEDVLPECDYLLNVMPATPDTNGLLDQGKLKLCQTKKACFINIGRGNIIKESELIYALDQGWISGAILDVFPIEPLPSSSPLWSRDDVVLTPHIAAITRPQEVADLFAINYRRFVDEEPNGTKKELKYALDWKQGY